MFFINFFEIHSQSFFSFSFFKFGLRNFLECELFTYSKGSVFSFVKCRCSYLMKIVERGKTGYFYMQSAHVVTGSLQVLSKCDLPFLSLLGFTGEICGLFSGTEAILFHFMDIGRKNEKLEKHGRVEPKNIWRVEWVFFKKKLVIFTSELAKWSLLKLV